MIKDHLKINYNTLNYIIDFQNTNLFSASYPNMWNL